MQGLPQNGQILDETYEILSLLGKGGFGAVYLARQINMEREVALKVLVASGPKFEEMVKRFRREVMAIRNLTHPNTIRIYDYRDESGILYYTMEALRGLTLKDLVEQNGPVSPKRAKQITRQILKSLSEAHSYGIVHRDLKPANIMLVDMHGETDFVKVLDFGIAKIMSEPGEEEEKEQLTSAGILVGTLRYMSPEQITGDNIGPASDLYALALIMVEMMTGESVFAGSGRWDVLQQQISEEPVRLPEQLAQTTLGPVLLKALEKRQDNRYKTADEMLKALDAVSDASLGDESVFILEEGGGFSARNPVVTPSYGRVSIDAGFADMNTEIGESVPQELLTRNRAGTIPPGAALTPQRISATNPDNTGEFAAASGGGMSKAMLGLAVLLLLVIVGGVYVFVIAPPTKTVVDEYAEAVPVPPEPVADEHLAIAPIVEEEVPEEIAVEAPVEEVQPLMVRLQTGRVTAIVFDGDELLGHTPLRLPVREASEFRLEAEGYETVTVKLNPDSPELVDVTLEKIKVEPVAAIPTESQREPAVDRPVGATTKTTTTTTTTTSSARPPRETTAKTVVDEKKAPSGDQGWVELGSAKKKTEPAKTEPAKTDAWVDVKPETKKAVEKKVSDIPLF
ncbi:MAG: serine/threonine protein kinase [Bradymonadaceae bacterium]|nr:serine/threonine protein kinase [Lujinxingiaceae bacterium]